MIFKEVPEIVRDQAGRWIRFGGFGIMDGMKGNPYKRAFYKIYRVNNIGLVITPYKCKNRKILPFCNWNQECEIRKSIKDLPEWEC